ncbi:TPA: hypothetical protein ACH3X2_006938 [Trebouxia sp. C0005]
MPTSGEASTCGRAGLVPRSLSKSAGSAQQAERAQIATHDIRCPAGHDSLAYNHENNSKAHVVQAISSKTAQRSVLLRKSRPGYEKLKPYGFLVHGCIDGGSNFVVYATVALDKSRPTLLKEFEAVTAKFGLPQRLRSDMALEAAFAGQHMWEEHGPESYMVGRSTVNQDVGPVTHRIEQAAQLTPHCHCLQRIENFWNWVWRSWAADFKRLFHHF